MAFDGNALLQGILGGSELVRQSENSTQARTLARAENKRREAEEARTAQTYEVKETGRLADSIYESVAIAGRDFYDPNKPTQINITNLNDPEQSAIALRIFNHANPDNNFNATDIVEGPDGKWRISGTNKDGTQGVLTVDGGSGGDSTPITWDSAEDLNAQLNIGFRSVLSDAGKFNGVNWLAAKNLLNSSGDTTRVSTAVTSFNGNPQVQRGFIASLAEADRNGNLRQFLAEYEKENGSAEAAPTDTTQTEAEGPSAAYQLDAEQAEKYQSLLAKRSELAAKLKDIENGGPVDAARRMGTFAATGRSLEDYYASEVEKIDEEIKAMGGMPFQVQMARREGDNPVTQLSVREQMLAEKGGSPSEREFVTEQVAQLEPEVVQAEKNRVVAKAEQAVKTAKERYLNAKGDARARLGAVYEKKVEELEALKSPLIDAAPDAESQAVITGAHQLVDGKTAAQIGQELNDPSSQLSQMINSPQAQTAMRQSMLSSGIRKPSDLEKLQIKDKALAYAFIAATTEGADKTAAMKSLSNVLETGMASITAQQQRTDATQRRAQENTAQSNRNTAIKNQNELRLKLAELQKDQKDNIGTNQEEAAETTNLFRNVVRDRLVDPETGEVLPNNRKGINNAVNDLVNMGITIKGAKYVDGKEEILVGGLNQMSSLILQSMAASDSNGLLAKFNRLFVDEPGTGITDNFELDRIILDDPKDPQNIIYMGPNNEQEGRGIPIKEIRKISPKFANYLLDAGKVNTKLLKEKSKGSK